MRKSRHEWRYVRGHPLKAKLGDPRIHLIKHMGWANRTTQAFPDKTHWQGVEPDNYTHGIASDRPHFIEGIEHQCWFNAKKLWFSVYVLDDTNQHFYDDYVKSHKVYALWTCSESRPMRGKITRIEHEAIRRWGKEADEELTMEERLYDMGYVDRLVDMGVDKEFIRKYMGEPRKERAA